MSKLWYLWVKKIPAHLSSQRDVIRRKCVTWLWIWRPVQWEQYDCSLGTVLRVKPTWTWTNAINQWFSTLAGKLLKFPLLRQHPNQLHQKLRGAGQSSIYFFQFRFFYFRERGREGEREGEKHQCVVASHVPSTRDLACNPGMCPRLGIKPATIRFSDQHSIYWATSVRAIFFFNSLQVILMYSQGWE